MTTQKQRLFITGASGYVGSATTELAVADGYEVHGLSRSDTGDEILRSLGAVPVRGDLTTLDVLRTESANADAVIHLATAFRIGVDDYEDILPIDNAAVDAIADGLAGSGKPLIGTSGTLITAPDPTGAETNEASPVDPDPIITRVKHEQYALSLVSRDIRVMGVRLAPYVYGRGGSGVKLFMGMAMKNGSVTCVEGGKNHITSVHVDDAARLYLLAVQKGKAGELFNASADTNLTARQLWDAMSAALGVPVRDITFPEAEAQVGKTFAWFLSAEGRASGAKAVKELGWQPREVGILDEINKGSYQAVAQELRKQES